MGTTTLLYLYIYKRQLFFGLEACLPQKLKAVQEKDINKRWLQGTQGFNFGRLFGYIAGLPRNKIFPRQDMARPWTWSVRTAGNAAGYPLVAK